VASPYLTASAGALSRRLTAPSDVRDECGGPLGDGVKRCWMAIR